MKRGMYCVSQDHNTVLLYEQPAFEPVPATLRQKDFQSNFLNKISELKESLAHKVKGVNQTFLIFNN